MVDSQISRAHVCLARALVAADITRREAGKRTGWDPGHIGKVLKGRAPGKAAMIKASAFVEDRDMWFQPASEDEQAEMRRLMDLIEARARRKGSPS